MEDSGGCERQRVDESRKNVRSYEREPVDFGTCFEVPVHSLTLVATTLIRIQNPLAGARSYQTYSDNCRPYLRVSWLPALLEIRRSSLIAPSLTRHPRVRLQILRDLVRERLAAFGALLFAHARDAFHLPDASGVVARHCAQRRVAKNNVRRHAAFVGEFLAERAQTLEEDLVARD